MIIIDADNAVAGRVASYAAKQSLLGEKVDVVNAEKAVITGSKKRILQDWNQKLQRGNPSKGPHFIRWPERILRRMARGMLPYKQARGAEAFKRIKCHSGVPDEFKDKDIVKVPGSDVSKTMNLKYLSLGELSKLIMGK